MWGEHWELLSISLLEPRLDDLSEGNGVAGAASTLVSQWVCEIKAVNASHVILLWDLIVWDIISCAVVGVPILNRGIGLHECLATFLSELKSFLAFLKFDIELIVNLGEFLSLLLS